MNKTLLGFVAAVALVIGLMGGFLISLNQRISSKDSLGVSITASNVLNQQRLANEFSAVATPLSGWLATSTTMNTLTVGSTTVQSSTITLTGVLPGDYIVFGESTSTGNVNLNCTASAANTILCTKTTAVPGSAGVSAVTSTIYVQDLPRTTFISPTGL